jgi:hypothetical protein
MELANNVRITGELMRQAEFVSKMYVQTLKSLFKMEHVKIVEITHEQMLMVEIADLITALIFKGFS